MGDQPASPLTFGSFERLQRSSDFFRARRKGTKRVGSSLVIWAYLRDEVPFHPSRLGLVVGRKAGGAVARNLFKRRVREIFRLNKGVIGRGWDLVVCPKRGERKAFPPAQSVLKDDLLRLVKSCQKSVRTL